ncbi:hypothetical protein AB4305_28905 [Nocardia sp. 2YAB30]|uniref:hypothetical protein n=1 Tax=Nocardia sp. 2YAB30 TaxID=3233022 RepID=UPI003F983A6C
MAAKPVAHDKLPVAPGKSGCPITTTIEFLGDRWSLIILRDSMSGGMCVAVSARVR